MFSLTLYLLYVKPIFGIEDILKIDNEIEHTLYIGITLYFPVQYD